MGKESVRNDSTLFILIAFFIAVLIVSNIASVKITGFGWLLFDAGTILFPLAYIIDDIITEVYGFRLMRRLIFIGLGTLVITSLTFTAVQALPPATDWPNQEAYETILGQVPRIVAASMIAYFIGELANSYILARLKVKTKGKYLWGRLMGSSVIGHALDTVIFTIVAFAGILSGSMLLHIIATVFAIKMATEVVVSPITIRIIKHIKKTEKTNVTEFPQLLS